jgi:hypothetical protein
MSLLRFLIYGNILVSISVGVLTFGISVFLGFDESLFYGMSSFFATLFIYNLQRLLRFEDVKSQTSVRHEWLVRNKFIVIAICSFGALGAMTTYLVLGIQSDFFLVAGLSVLGFLYAYQGKTNSALRDLPFLKIYLITAVWALVCVLWPAYREDVLNPSTLYLLLSVGLYIFSATIPFDIRDLVYDKSSQKTIPQLLGVRGSKILAIISLLCSAIILYKMNALFLKNVFYYGAYIGMATLVFLTETKRKEMFFSGLIDGWIITLGLMFFYQFMFINLVPPGA